MLAVIMSAAFGALLGAGLGYFGQCSSGTCPLTSTWWRGALYGAAVGTVVGFSSGRGVAPWSANTEVNSTNVVHVSQTDFESRVVRATQLVLVDFYAPWCGPCKAMAPVVAKLADEYAGRLQVAKVNVDEAPRLSEIYRVEGIPMLVFFQNGKVVDSAVGLISEQELRHRIDRLIKSPAAPVGRSTS